jgi:hypothetical protein
MHHRPARTAWPRRAVATRRGSAKTLWARASGITLPLLVFRKETEILNWLALAAVLIVLGSIVHTIIKWRSGR